LQRAEIDVMRRRSFPLNLLPTTPLQAIQPAEQLIIWPTSSTHDTMRAT
jgi:hypothetical protein